MEEETIVLRNKIIIGVIVGLIFVILVFMVAHNLWGNYTGKVYDKIVDNETFAFLYTTDKCKMCDSVRNVLDENNIEYDLLTMSNKDKHEDVFRKLDLDSSKIKAPSLFIIKKGELVSYLNDIDNETVLNSFIKNYFGG